MNFHDYMTHRNSEVPRGSLGRGSTDPLGEEISNIINSRQGPLSASDNHSTIRGCPTEIVYVDGKEVHCNPENRRYDIIG